MNQDKEKWRLIITKCTLLSNWERHTQRMWKQMSFTQFWQPGHFCLLKKAAMMQTAGSLSCRIGVAPGTEFARPQGFKVSILWQVVESFYMAKVRVMSIFNQQNTLWIPFCFLYLHLQSEAQFSTIFAAIYFSDLHNCNKSKKKKKYCAEIYHNFVSAFNFWSSTLHLKCVLHFPAAREGKGQMIIFNFSEVCTSWPNSFEIILLFHVNKSCCYSTECLYSTETVLGTEYSLL